MKKEKREIETNTRQTRSEETRENKIETDRTLILSEKNLHCFLARPPESKAESLM